VLSNGYCHVHQSQAYQKLLLVLQALDHSLSGVSGSDLQLFRQNVRLRYQDLRSRGALCPEGDTGCREALRALVVQGQGVLDSLPSQVASPVARLLRAVVLLTYQSSGLHTQALQVNLDSQLQQQANQRHQAEVQKVEEEHRQLAKRLQSEVANHSETEQRYQSAQAQLTQQSAKAEQVVQELQQQLTQCQNSRLHRSEGLAQKLRQAQDQMEAQALVVDELKREREQRDRSLRRIADQLSQTEAGVAELQASYEAKEKALRDEFAAQQRQGDRIDNSREVELNNQIESLEAHLADSRELIQKLTAAGPDGALSVDWSRVQSEVGQNVKSLTTQLSDLSERLAAKEQERRKLEDQNRKLREHLLRLEEKVSGGNDENEAELQQLRVDRNKAVGDLKRAVKSEEKLGAKLQHTKELLTGQIQQLKTSLDSRTSKLRHLIKERQRNKAYVAEQQRLLDQREQALHKRQAYQERTLRERYRQQFAAKMRAEERNLEQLKADLQSQSRTLQSRELVLKTQFEAYQQARSQFNKYKAQYQEKHDSWAAEREQLRTQLATAQQELKQLRALEHDYESRVTQARHAQALAKEQYHQSTEALRERLRRVQEGKAQVERALSQCSLRRAHLVAQIQKTGEENQTVRQQLIDLQQERDRMRRTFEKEMKQMRSTLVDNERTVQAYHARLKDASQAHEHVLEMRNQTARMVKALSRRAQDLKNAEKAAQELIKAKELQDSKLLELQQANEDLHLRLSTTDSTLKQSKQQLRHVRRLEQERAQEAKQLSDELESALRLQQAELRKREFATEAERKQMMVQLEEARLEVRRLQESLEQSQRQKQVLAQEFLESDRARSRQMQELVLAETRA